MLSYAVLLDAGFVKRKLHPLFNPLEAANIEQLVSAIRSHAMLQEHRLHRVYFYDAIPLSKAVDHPVTGEVIEYGATEVYHRNASLLKAVAQLPHVALRQGELQHDGWMAKWSALIKGKNYNRDADELTLKSLDLKPVIRQKGVDMRIGMDIAALTLKKHVDIVVLVTADSDFVPAMKFARREGAQLYLFSLGHGIKEDVIANADCIVSSTAKTLIDALAKDAVGQSAEPA